MFEEMINSIREEIVRRMFLAQVRPQAELKREKVAKVTSEGGAGDKTVKKQPVVKKAKVGRNDPCPCGSGKKYKNCCLDKDLQQ
jgi:preprotein translocase subunit SecA